MKKVTQILKNKIDNLVKENRVLFNRGHLFEYQQNAVRIQTLNRAIVIVNNYA